MYKKIELLINTVKYLKPSQIYYRIANRLKRLLFKYNILKVKIPNNIKVNDNHDYIIPELDFNNVYLNRFDMEGLLQDRFTFINLTKQVNLSEAWNNREIQHLWRYNLHYFEYLYSLGNAYLKNDNQDIYYNKFRNMVINWIDNNPLGFGDGWHPYTISLRITNWISAYQIFEEAIKSDNELKNKFIESLYSQYKYLQLNLEKDVLGNHYFENIKALILGSIFFKEENVKEKFKKELLEQLKDQILEDGMHFELSPMYHKIILEDLIKIAYWLRNEAIYRELIIYIKNMTNVTYSLEKEFGKTPAFNDSADGVSKNYKDLLAVSEKYFQIKPEFKSKLEYSGYYIVEDPEKKLIFDTGEICPSYLPAHGHCDALSFELSINGVPFIVNSGTYQYETGKWRNYFRSTKAHNTISISGQEQSQFWGSFRVAKRIKNVKRKSFVYNHIQFYGGSYVSYSGDKHKRFIGYIDDNSIIVLDYVNTNKETESYLHFVPKIFIQNNKEFVTVKKGDKTINLTPIAIKDIEIGKGWYSEQFNLKEENNHLIFNKEKSESYFGYLIELNEKNKKVFQINNGIKIIGDKEQIINFNELGVWL